MNPPQQTPPRSCRNCSKVFQKSKQLKRHHDDYHKESLDIKFINQHGVGECFRVFRPEGGNGPLSCPFCPKKIVTRKGIKDHISKNICGFVPVKSINGTPIAETLQDNLNDTMEDSIKEQRQSHIAIEDNLNDTINQQEVNSSTTTTTNLKRPFRELAVEALEQSQAKQSEKRRALLHVDLLEMTPVIARNNQGEEEILLAHVKKLDRLSSKGPFSISTEISLPDNIPPDSRCSKCQPIQAPELEEVIQNSPYVSLLKQRKYVELDKIISQFLNEDWALKKIGWRSACAKILAGCILVKTTGANSHAILVNCIEVYGRKKNIDVHCEPFPVSKEFATKTSIPGSHKNRYVGVYPTTMHSIDGERLVIGTHTMNALVTSSIRIDQKEKPSVGGKTLSFLVEDETSSFNTRIYLDQESIDRALEIVSDKDIWFSEHENKLEQIRQIRSKFDKLQTYHLCRAWGPLTPGHSMQPYSIFTLVSNHSSEKGAGRAAAHLFNQIAVSVLLERENATLDHSVLEESLGFCKKSSQILDILNTINTRFSGEQTIPIIGNEELDRDLKELAQLLVSSYIEPANKKSAAFIEKQFST